MLGTLCNWLRYYSTRRTVGQGKVKIRCLFFCSKPAMGKTSQNRSHLLFHGLIRLWLRNSGLALKQSRHRRLISSHEITQMLTMFCSCLFHCFLNHSRLFLFWPIRRLVCVTFFNPLSFVSFFSSDTTCLSTFLMSYFVKKAFKNEITYKLMQKRHLPSKMSYAQ